MVVTQMACILYFAHICTDDSLRTRTVYRVNKVCYLPQVKLVGSTISCEGVPEYYIDSGEARQNPHVQSYAVATDQVRRCAVSAAISNPSGGRFLTRACWCDCVSLGVERA